MYVCVYVTVGKKSHTSVTLAREKVSRKGCYALHTHTRTHTHAHTQRKNTQSQFNNYFTKTLSFTIWVVSWSLSDQSEPQVKWLCFGTFDLYVNAIITCYSPDGRSVLGKTVPSVLSTAWGRRRRAALKTSDTVFPIMDRPRLANNIFFFFNLAKFYPKECEWFRAVNTARSSINWAIFEQVNGS